MISLCIQSDFSLLSNQMFLPAFIFIGLDQEDCCGCCGHENCGKRCAVGLPSLVGKWSLRGSCDVLCLTSGGPPSPRCCLLYWLHSLELEALATVSLWLRWPWRKDQGAWIPVASGTIPLPTQRESKWLYPIRLHILIHHVCIVVNPPD